MKKILLAGLIAGTLDATAAVLIYAKPVNRHNAAGIFRYVASGVFGQHTHSAGPLYPVLGLILHYCIAMIWSAVYMLLFSRFFKSGNVWAKALLYGSTVWVLMNAFVVPLSGITAHSDSWGMMRSFTIILFCVGLPITLIAERRI